MRVKLRLRRGYSSVSENRKLETKEDWTQLQQERRHFKLLIDHLTPYGSSQSRSNTWQPFHSLSKPPSPASITAHSRTHALSALLASSAHIGHSSSLLNPNFLPYTYGSRAGLTLIDLERTLDHLRRAVNLTRSIAQKGGGIVFVGTRPAFRDAVFRAANRIGRGGYYVADKWLPGTLTNRLQMHPPELSTHPNTQILPSLVVLLNPLQNLPAIRECAISHIPTIGVVDSNADPRIVMYPVPANDESRRTAELVAGVLSVAAREGAEICWEREKRDKEKAERRKREWARARERGDVDF